MRYQLYLEDQRKLTAESEKTRKKKAVQDEIRVVESKRKFLTESIASMSQEADALAVQAEKNLFYFPGFRHLRAATNIFRPEGFGDTVTLRCWILP